MTTRKIGCILRLLTIWLASVVTLHAFAGPARPGMIKVIQSDGTSLRIRVHGDEFQNYVTTEEGYTLTADKDGDWAFARLGADGQLVSTGVKAKPAGRLTAEERRILGGSLRKGIRPLGMTAFQRQLKASAYSRLTATRAGSGLNEAPPLLGGTSWKAMGKKKILVILAEYPDKPFTVGSKEAFNDMLNSRSYTAYGATGSAWSYYYDNSNGKFDPEFTVAGPYRLSHGQAWYKDDAIAMASEAARLADADVDFSQFAENGAVHDIFVFYSGGAQSDGEPNGIWPHRSTMPGITLDGVTLSGYACSSEIEPALSGSGKSELASIGSFCHEFGHIIGWPDFYDTNSNDGSEGLGPGFYSLMDYGTYNNEGRTPPALGILERWMMGWAEPEVLEKDGKYTLESITDGKGYLIKTETEGDFFLLECRGTGKTVWDRKEYLDYYGFGPDWGLMVHHINNTNASLWIGNGVNCAKGRECYKILCSNPDKSGNVEPVYIPKHCFFPGGNNVREIFSSGRLGFMSSDGKKAEMNVRNITTDEANGSASFSATSFNGAITEVNLDVFQHDILMRWKDDVSSEWTVEWTTTDGKGETKSVLTRSRELNIPLLDEDREYKITLKGDKTPEYVYTGSTAISSSNAPRIILSKGNPSSSESFLMTLVDCGNMSGVQWYVDGAKTDNLVKLRKGEHYVQAVVTRADGTAEYFVRFVNIAL